LPSISCSGSGIGFSAFAVESPELPAGLSASTGGLLGEVEEVEEVWDVLPAGSASVSCCDTAKPANPDQPVK
jgi:hypothetical protein